MFAVRQDYNCVSTRRTVAPLSDLSLCISRKVNLSHKVIAAACAELVHDVTPTSAYTRRGNCLDWKLGLKPQILAVRI